MLSFFIVSQSNPAVLMSGCLLVSESKGRLVFKAVQFQLFVETQVETLETLYFIRVYKEFLAVFFLVKGAVRSINSYFGSKKR